MRSFNPVLLGVSADGQAGAMDSRKSKQRRIHWSREEIEELISRYEASGQRQVEFCREWGLALSSFQTYLRRRRRASGAAEKRAGFEAAAPRLVEVEIETAKQVQNEPGKLEVILPNGYRIGVSERFAEGSLLRLVEVLERAGR
jgi:hypothetical protein